MYDEKITKVWTKSQKETYYKNKEVFINEFGIEAWNNKNKIKDSMSLDFFKSKYEANFENKRSTRIKSIISRRPEHLNKQSCLLWLNRKSINIFSENDFYNKLDKLFDDKNIISIKYIIDACFIENENNTANNKVKLIWINYSIIVYDIEKHVLYKRYGIDTTVETSCEYVNKLRNGNRSYCISEDGFYFRSGYEYTLYIKLKSINIEILDINKKYPDSAYYYDFYVIINNTLRYIELCGDYKKGIYRETQFIKKSAYNSILIGYKHINKFIRDLQNGTFNESNIYY